MKLQKKKIYVNINSKKIKLIILLPKNQNKSLPVILWIHGGGYVTGMAEMVYFSRAKEIASKFPAVVISPEYTLANKSPYPAAINDCYDVLLWIKNNAKQLGISCDQIIVGGESAGGGLAIALCMMALDKKEVKIAFQLPLYPMIDCFKTASNVNNHGYIWNSKLNDRAWKKYLNGITAIHEYASPSRRKCYEGLPPCYTFVSIGEPFYTETVNYVHELYKVGIDAKVDVYEGKTHAFDLLFPFTKKAKLAREKLLENYEIMLKKYCD